MNILGCIALIICVFIVALFGAAAYVMIEKDRNEKKLISQIELLNEIESLREEYYEDNKKLNERITLLNINQQVLEGNLEKFINKYPIGHIKER